jgi:hypothetical protein
MSLNSIRVPIGCTSELSHKGQQFVSTWFERHDKDKDGALSPAEVDSLFSTCPSPLWGHDFRRTVSTNSKVLYFIDVWGFKCSTFGDCDILNHVSASCVMYYSISSFSGLVVRMLASGTQDRGFEPGQSRRIFRSEGK